MLNKFLERFLNITVYVNRNEIGWNKVADKFMIIFPKSKQTFILNKTAGEIFEIILLRRVTVQEIFENLKIRYPYTPHNVILDDLLNFILAGIKTSLIRCENSKAFISVLKNIERKEQVPIKLTTFNSFEDFLPRISDYLIVPIPVTVHLDLTYDCNLKCIHCYLDCPRIVNDEMQYEEIELLLQKLREMGTVDLTISGGEPFLVPDVAKIITKARELGFAVTVITNGTLLKPEIIDPLAKYNIKFAVSLYGLSADVHDSITQKRGSFYKTWDAINYLKSKDAILSIKTILLNQNLSEYRQLSEKIEEMGIEHERDFKIVPKLNNPMAECKDAVSVEKVLSEFGDDITQKFINRKRKSLVCIAGRQRLYISPSGDLFPCFGFLLKCGNVREEDIKKIWHENAGLQFIRMLSDENFQSCRDCNAKSVCEFCIGFNNLVNGNIFLPYKWTCEFSKKFFLFIEKRKGEKSAIKMKGGDNYG